MSAYVNTCIHDRADIYDSDMIAEYPLLNSTMICAKVVSEVDIRMCIMLNYKIHNNAF